MCHGADDRGRTYNLLITSQLLYLLSYTSMFVNRNRTGAVAAVGLLRRARYI